jgi:carboxyl-terminal processing protease
MKKLKHIVSLTLVVLLLFSGTLHVSASEYGDYFDTMLRFVSDMYYKGLTDEEGLKAALKGLFSSLDKYSVFYDREETKALNSSLNGNFVGVGIALEKVDTGIKITKVYQDSPADKAGVLEGDIITAVDDVSVVGKDAETAAAAIRGNAGEPVKLTIKRGDTIKQFNIVRATVTVSSIHYRIEDNVAYIRIDSFTSGVGVQFARVMDTVDKHNIRKILLDLRNNPGGYVDEAVSVARRLMPQGIITTLDYKSEEIVDRVYTNPLKNPEYIVGVLVNEGSASASEILAGALEDSGIGFMVGQKTYGKGIFQSVFSILTPEAFQKYSEEYGEKYVTQIQWLSYHGVFPEDDDILGTVTITTGYYLTPKGRIIDGVGLKPHVTLPNPTAPNNVDLALLDLISSAEELKLDAYGADVYNAESILKAAGYFSSTPDRRFDEATSDALRAYQKQKGLSVTGVIDSRTRNSLNLTLIELRSKNDQQYAKALEILNWFRD